MNFDDFFPSKYLKASDLNGQDHLVKILRIESARFGNDPQEKGLLRLDVFDKPFILNKTQATAIRDIFGTKNLDLWIGQQIVVYPTTTPYRGAQVETIGVKAPKNAPQPPPTGGTVPF